jgi:ferredoxin
MFRVVIDGLACAGFGECAEIAPEVFELDAGGKAWLRTGTTSDPAVLDAAAACPMGAICVREEAAA